MDSSVWIARLRGQTTPAAALVNGIIGRAPLVVGDLVLVEILQGGRDDLHAARIEHELRRFGVHAIVTPDLTVEAARHNRRLRQAGATIRRTTDLLIGTFCLARGWPLLHQDRDLDAVERHLGPPVLRAAT